MNLISVNYTVEWELDFATEYKWSKCGKCFNANTRKELKQCYKNGMIGYYVRSKFYSLKFLRRSFIKINLVLLNYLCIFVFK